MSPEQGFLVMSYIGTAVQVVADWSCAITPFFIVWSLQMPRRAKISVVCVLGLGILASIAALMRIVSYKYIDTRYYPKDHMSKAVHYPRHQSPLLTSILVAQGRLVLWSVFESGFAIIACSLPPLKKLVSGLIGRSFGRTTDPSRPSVRNSSHEMDDYALLTRDVPLHRDSQSTPRHPCTRLRPTARRARLSLARLNGIAWMMMTAPSTLSRRRKCRLRGEA